MTIPPAFLDEIRARVGLAAVVGRRVKLVRAGHEWKGCCPFHNEKTPSFYVNEDKGFYHCFGCGVHGDVIRFVTEQEGLSFPDAVRALAAEAGLEMPEASPEAGARARAAQGLHEVMGAAADWFREQLGGIEGAAARDYLARRGVDAATARSFGLGFAPDARGRLRTALAALGADKLVETGLVIAPDPGSESGAGSGREPYDRFRGRLMFPIRDPRGRVIAFGGRILGDGQPKYLNSPDTLLFDKGRTLYNFDRAGPLARKSLRLLVVEGYMDVIALAQAGLGEAVAPLGTALTEDQMKLLWRVVPEPILCFDGDAAGQRAGLRAALRALPLLEPGRSLRFALLPPGRDPDDLVRDGGAAAMTALVDAAEPLIELLWRSETEGADTATPERRAALRERLRGHARAIAHPGVRELYAREFADRFAARFAGGNAPGRVVGRVAGRGAPPLAGASPALRALQARPGGEGELAALLLGVIERPELAEHHGEALARLPVHNPALARLRAALLDATMAAPDLDKARLAHTLAASGLTTLIDEVRRSTRLRYAFTEARSAGAEAVAQFGLVLDNLLARRRIEDELGEVTQRLRDTMDENDYAAQNRLIAERQRVNDALLKLAARARGDD